MAKTRVEKHLRIDGNGSRNLSVVGTLGTPVRAYVECPPGKTIHCVRLMTTISDVGTFEPENFGAFVAPLVNGINIKVWDADDSVLLDITDNDPITDNLDWSDQAGPDVQPQQFGKSTGADVEGLVIRWTIGAADLDPIIITPGQKIGYEIRDDLSGLVKFHAHLQGNYR